MMHSCRHDLEEDFHEDITLIERMSGFNRTEVTEILKTLTNLGFEYKFLKSEEGCEEEGNIHEYERLSVKLISRMPELALDNLTIVLALMYLGAMGGKCESCCFKTLNRLDFSDLKEKPDEDELDVNPLIYSGRGRRSREQRLTSAWRYPTYHTPHKSDYSNPYTIRLIPGSSLISSDVFPLLLHLLLPPGL